MPKEAALNSASALKGKRGQVQLTMQITRGNVPVPFFEFASSAPSGNKLNYVFYVGCYPESGNILRRGRKIMTTIKLMADYDCYPLWNKTPGQYGNIDPESLPLTKSLRQELLDWVAAYNKILNRDDPLSSRFPTAQDKVEFNRKGLELAQRMQSELGAEHVVIYKQEGQAEVVIRSQPMR